MADKYLWNIGGADLYLWKVGSKGGGAETELPFGFQAVISEEDETVTLISQTGLSSETVAAIKAAAGKRALAKDDDEHSTPVFVTEENGKYSIWDQGVYAARINSQLTSNTVSVLKYDLEDGNYEVFCDIYAYDDVSYLYISCTWPDTFTESGSMPGYWESVYRVDGDSLTFTWNNGASDNPLYNEVVLTRVSGEKGSVFGKFALIDESGNAELTVELTDGPAYLKWTFPYEGAEIGTSSYVIDGYTDDGYIASAHGFSGMKMVYYYEEPKAETGDESGDSSIQTKTVSNMVMENIGDAPNSWKITVEFDDGTTYEGTLENNGGSYGICTASVEVDRGTYYKGYIFSVPSDTDCQSPFEYASRRVVISGKGALIGKVKMVKGGAEYTLGSNSYSSILTLSKDGNVSSTVNLKKISGTSIVGSGSISFKTVNGTSVVGSGNIEASGSKIIWVDY